MPKNKRLSPKQKRQIRSGMGDDTGFKSLSTTAFANYRKVDRREIVAYIHNQYIRCGWYHDAKESVAWFSRTLNKEELQTIIRNAIFGGLTDSLRCAMEEMGRTTLTNQEIKILLTKHTREGIDTFGKTFRRRVYRSVLCLCVTILVEKGDLLNARLLSNFILKKPLNAGLEETSRHC